MKRLLFVLLALLIASPAMAVVTITATDEGGGWVRLNYTVSGESYKMRALALDVSTSIGNITNIRGYKTDGLSSYIAGPPIVNKRGYGIFPGTIDLTNPASPVWNTPVAPATDPGAAGTGLGTGRIIIEMGSLYDPDVPTDGPDNTGVLCRFRVTTYGNVTINKEATYRGGIVMENASPPGSDNLPVVLNNVGLYTGPSQAAWNTCNKPASWANQYQCYGDADGLNEVSGRNMVPVGMEDVYLLIDGFRDLGFDGVAGRPQTPAAGPFICADFDHLGEISGRNTVRVGMNDVYILVERFRDLPATLTPSCQVP